MNRIFSLQAAVFTTLAFSGLALSGPAMAMPMTYDFVQDFGDASVTGHFTGEDTTLDGVISFADGEIFAFIAEWSGNGDAEAASFDIGGLVEFYYDLDGWIGNDGGDPLENVLVFGDGDSDWVAGPAFLGCNGGDCGAIEDFNSNTAFTSNAVQVTLRVPEPGMIGLFGLGLSAIGMRRRRS